MELRTIKIQNFRPYRDIDDGTVDLTGQSGHIHVIQGPQGAGKTSFHRAVQWGFYGGQPAENYRENWNEVAREAGEPIRVEMKLRDGADSHILTRKLDMDSVDRGGRRAWDELEIISGGEETRTGENAQEWINSRIPKDLKDFFYLDGEDIQNRVHEGKEIREDIETVLKHTAILNAREDLETLISDYYNDDIAELEAEIDERDEINDKIKQRDEERRELIGELGDLEDENEELKNKLDEARELLKKQNKEAKRKLDDIEDDMEKLVERRSQLRTELRDAWDDLPYAILSEKIDQLIDALEEDRERVGEKVRQINLHQEFENLIEGSENDGKCPLCGTDTAEEPEIPTEDLDTDRGLDELEKRRVVCQNHLEVLRAAPELNRLPSAIEDELIEIRSDLDDKRDRKEDLLEEVGGLDDTETGKLESNIGNIEDEIDSNQDEIDNKQDEIDKLSSKLEELRKRKKEMASPAELDKIERKREVAKTLIDCLRDVRDSHIKQKREKIKEEMNEIFSKVSQSRFISQRYDRIDFEGNPDEEEEYVLQLIKKDGEPKDMTNHPPSAGETQLTALSFIFGLNKYSNYSTTIVFDTVAGRLDLENSQAQGEFFSSLEDPIILLVTDAELEKLEDSMIGNIGAHYKLEPQLDGAQMHSELVEVDR